MKINQLSFALASAISTAIVWIICSLLVWTLPRAMMDMTGSMVHMEMNRGGWMLSPLGVFWGLIAWSLSAGIFAWLMAAIYNWLNRK